MKIYKSIFLAPLVLLFVSNLASAMPLEGSISFSGNATTTATGAPGSLDNPGEITSVEFQTLTAGVVNGDFSSFVSVNQTATFTDLTPVAATNNLWNIGGFTFDLLDVTQNFVVFGSGIINGTGVITGNGFDATFVKWNFSSEVGSPKTFSATAVPAPAGVVLLGVALIGFGFSRRQKKSQ